MDKKYSLRPLDKLITKLEELWHSLPIMFGSLSLAIFLRRPYLENSLYDNVFNMFSSLYDKG
jgi:hypothetical protein